MLVEVIEDEQLTDKQLWYLNLVKELVVSKVGHSGSFYTSHISESITFADKVVRKLGLDLKQFKG